MLGKEISESDLKYRKWFNYIFITILIVLIIVFIYFIIASLSDLYPFKNRRLLGNNHMLPRSLIKESNNFIEKTLEPPVLSILTDSNALNSNVNRTFYRAGVQVQTLTSVPVTSIIWRDWVLFKDNKVNNTTISLVVSKPLGIIESNDYKIVVFIEEGASNTTYSSSTSVTLLPTEFINTLLSGTNLTINPILTVNYLVHTF